MIHVPAEAGKNIKNAALISKFVSAGIELSRLKPSANSASA